MRQARVLLMFPSPVQTFTVTRFASLEKSIVTQEVLVYPNGYVIPPSPPPPTAPDKTFPLVFVWNMTITLNPQEETIEEYVARIRGEIQLYFAESFGEPPSN